MNKKYASYLLKLRSTYAYFKLRIKLLRRNEIIFNLVKVYLTVIDLCYYGKAEKLIGIYPVKRDGLKFLAGNMGENE